MSASMPQPVSRTAQQDVVAGLALRAAGPGVARSTLDGLDGDAADPGDGVAGVDDEVGEDLVDLAGIDVDRPQRRSRAATASSMSSPIRRCSIFSMPPMVSFRSSTRGLTVCRRAKASSCRVRSPDRAAALLDLLQVLAELRLSPAGSSSARLDVAQDAPGACC